MKYWKDDGIKQHTGESIGSTLCVAHGDHIMCVECVRVVLLVTCARYLGTCAFLHCVLTSSVRSPRQCGAGGF